MSAGGRLVARPRFTQRDALMDPPLRKHSPNRRVRRGPTTPTPHVAARPRSRGCVHDDRTGSGGLWERRRGTDYDGDPACGDVLASQDTWWQGADAPGRAQGRVAPAAIGEILSEERSDFGDVLYIRVHVVALTCCNSNLPTCKEKCVPFELDHSHLRGVYNSKILISSDSFTPENDSSY